MQFVKHIMDKICCTMTGDWYGYFLYLVLIRTWLGSWDLAICLWYKIACCTVADIPDCILSCNWNRIDSQTDSLCYYASILLLCYLCQRLQYSLVSGSLSRRYYDIMGANQAVLISEQLTKLIGGSCWNVDIGTHHMGQTPRLFVGTSLEYGYGWLWFP